MWTREVQRKCDGVLASIYVDATMVRLRSSYCGPERGFKHVQEKEFHNSVKRLLIISGQCLDLINMDDICSFKKHK